mmetsp:Transcript_18745/g.38438  ORF Transcript_18745/g.38438 Transcript_18745/m.38438 type:complete len:203 (+) Transcript_18745:160-768(+)
MGLIGKVLGKSTNEVETGSGSGDGSARAERKRKLVNYPIFYSPCYYWFKFLIAIVSTGSASSIWISYSSTCGDAYDYIGLMVWFFSLVVLWAIYGLVHLGIIIARAIKKSPPTESLYTGQIERKLNVYMTLLLGTVVIIAIAGVILFHSGHSSISCRDAFNRVTGHAYYYIIIGLLMMIKVGKGKTTDSEGDDQPEAAESEV